MGGSKISAFSFNPSNIFYASSGCKNLRDFFLPEIYSLSISLATTLIFVYFSFNSDTLTYSFIYTIPHVIYKSHKKQGSKNGVFSPIFDPILVLEPLYVVVKLYYFPSNHNTSSELYSQRAQNEETYLLVGLLLVHNLHQLKPSHLLLGLMDYMIYIQLFLA